MNRIVKILCISFMSLLFTACSTTGGDKGIVGGKDNVVDEGATATGIGAEEGYTDVANGNRLRAPYNQVYYFDFNDDTVHQEDIDSINAQARYLVSHPSAKVRLEGNADERGSREYNVALGWRRSKAALRILEQGGVSPKQIVMLSYGKEKPVAFGHDETSWRLNRRVNLVYESE